jgi:hypothetical protein
LPENEEDYVEEGGKVDKEGKPYKSKQSLITEERNKVPITQPLSHFFLDPRRPGRDITNSSI